MKEVRASQRRASVTTTESKVSGTGGRVAAGDGRVALRGRGAACCCQRVTGERAREQRGAAAQIKGDVSVRGCAAREQCKVTAFTHRSVSSMRR